MYDGIDIWESQGCKVNASNKCSRYGPESAWVQAEFGNLEAARYFVSDGESCVKEIRMNGDETRDHAELLETMHKLMHKTNADCSQIAYPEKKDWSVKFDEKFKSTDETARSSVSIVTYGTYGNVPVVLKKLLPGRKEVSNFHHTYHNQCIVNRIDNPHIMKMYDYRKVGDDDTTWEALVENGGRRMFDVYDELSRDDWCTWLRHVCIGVYDLHQRRLQHSDLSFNSITWDTVKKRALIVDIDHMHEYGTKGFLFENDNPDLDQGQKDLLAIQRMIEDAGSKFTFYEHDDHKNDPNARKAAWEQVRRWAETPPTVAQLFP